MVGVTREVSPSEHAVFERRLDARLVAAMLAAGSLSFSAVVFETAMNVALPALMEEFGVGTATIQWITSGYLLMLSVTIPVFPWLKSRFPLRSLFGCAVALFVVGTLACGFAPSFPVLLAGRLIQGAGTGIAIPLMFSIVVDQVPRDHMGLMMGFASLITALAPAVGPSYGGLVMGIAGWRAVFLALVPLVLVAAATGLACVRQATPLARSRFDAAGFALVAMGFSALVIGINRSAEAGWASMGVWGPLAISGAALAAFARRGARMRQRGSDHSMRPLIDVGVFSRLRFSLSAVNVALISFAILGFAYLVPNYAQLALGADALQSGTLLLPGCLASVVVGPIGGRLFDRRGAALPIFAGALFFVISTCIFALSADAMTPGLLMGVYVLFGIGQGLAFSTTMTYGLSGLPEGERADGNSVNNTLQQLGGSIGVSVVTAVVGAAQSGAESIAAGTRAGGSLAFILLAAMMALVFFIALGSLRMRRGAK